MQGRTLILVTLTWWPRLAGTSGAFRAEIHVLSGKSSRRLAVPSIVDTGFLVGLLDGSDPYHDWCVGVAPEAKGPWFTVEACIVEVVHCLQGRALPARIRLFDWMDRGLLITDNCLPISGPFVPSPVVRGLSYLSVKR